MLFVHGNFSNYQWFEDTLYHESLAAYHAISIDQRGFGFSTYNNLCESFEDWARDIGEFIKAKGIKKVNLIGWSFGGGISMKVAEMYPELV